MLAMLAWQPTAVAGECTLQLRQHHRPSITHDALDAPNYQLSSARILRGGRGRICFHSAGPRPWRSAALRSGVAPRPRPYSCDRRFGDAGAASVTLQLPLRDHCSQLHCSAPRAHSAMQHSCYKFKMQCYEFRMLNLRRCPLLWVSTDASS